MVCDHSPLWLCAGLTSKCSQGIVVSGAKDGKLIIHQLRKGRLAKSFPFHFLPFHFLKKMQATAGVGA